MIVTVTLNAAIDRTLLVPNFQLGQRHRASEGTSSAGGKGINVARAARRLGVPVVCTGLAGGRTGTLLVEELTNIIPADNTAHVTMIRAIHRPAPTRCSKGCSSSRKIKTRSR